MLTKLHVILSVLGWLSILAACTPDSPPTSITIAEDTPLPTSVATETAVNTSVATQGSAGVPTSTGFNCQNIQGISMEECRGLVALYKTTNGEGWLNHSGWLVDETACTWYGVICEQNHVTELQLYYNQLTGTVPPEIGNLKSLKSLYLDSNQLSGPLPAEIGNLDQLQILRLGNNQFNSIPAEFTNLDNLMYLELWGNQLSGEIPGEFGNFSHLLQLDLHNNNFTGSIPLELGKLTNLGQLNLADNQLNGQIPAELGNLVSLNQLNLSSNQLTGSIPTELGKLVNLYLLDLSYNQLTGEVPNNLTQLPMSERNLSGNQLAGTIPASTNEITSVDYGGVHFEINSKLLASIWPEVIPANPSVAGNPGWEVWPEHLRFTLAGSREQNNIPDRRSGFVSQPQILIYPAQEFSEMNELARPEIESLQSIIATRQSVSQDKLPFLPLVHGSQVFHAQAKQIDFQNGSGVRYITQYSQEVVGRLTNQDIFYTYQGITRDGKYYVTVVFPITASGLSDEPVMEDWATAQVHLAEDVQHLETLSSNDFAPNLDLLDNLIESLRVNIH